MGISEEVFASTVQEMMPKYSELFLVWNPLVEILLQRKQVERGRVEGPFKEFSVVTDGPGEVTQILTSNEIIEGGRKEATKKGNTYASRHIYAWDVPLGDLATTNTRTEVGNLLNRYPEMGLADFQQRFERQMLVGDGENVGGFTTFNGNATYTPLSGSARTGVFSFAAKASQTATVFDIPKEGAGSNPTTGWYNQFADITSFRLSGRKAMRSMRWACARQGGKIIGTPDIILADVESFENYADSLDEKIRFVDPTDMKKGDAVSPADDRPILEFVKMQMYQCEQLVRTASGFSGQTAADGLMYFLNSKTWHAYTQGQNKAQETNGDFVLRGPIRLPEQDMIRFEYVAHMGLFCNQLRANGVLTGTADE